MKIKLKYIFIFSILSLLFISCDEDYQDYVPYTLVDFTIDLTINNNLANPGYSELIPQAGYGGVIIYCEYYDFSSPSNSMYHAFDATCTNELSRECTVINEGNSFYAVCPCCSSKFELVTGYPVDGDAKKPLKYYNIGLLGNKIFVKN